MTTEIKWKIRVSVWLFTEESVKDERDNDSHPGTGTFSSSLQWIGKNWKSEKESK